VSLVCDFILHNITYIFNVDTVDNRNNFVDKKMHPSKREMHSP